MNRSRIVSLLLACATLLSISGSAAAYIDAGTGSLALQALISGLLGAVFVLRSFVGNYFKGKRSSTPKKSRAGEFEPPIA